MSQENSVVLDADVEALCNHYLQAERKHVRKEMKQSLDTFIGKLLAVDESTRNSWALQFARDVSDHGRDVPVRMPLFERILFPALRDGVIAKISGCARWLACFNLLLCQSQSCQNELPEMQRNESGLLLEALRVDPNDTQSRRRLVDADASHLRYCIDTAFTNFRLACSMG